MLRCLWILVLLPAVAFGHTLPDELGRRPRAPSPSVLSTDTATVWVFFTDKQIAGPADLEAAWRNLNTSRAGLEPGASDLPVPGAYVAAVAATGARIRHVSRWLGAASAFTTGEERASIESLPFVAFVEKVARGRRRGVESRTAAVAPQVAAYPLDYGLALIQLLPLHVPELHALGLTGKGVLIAVLDSGFRLLHDAFDSLNADGRVEGTWDFVRGDSGVANDTLDGPGQDFHGTEVLSTMAAHAPGQLVGAAFGSSYLLAKTEDLGNETPVEEDHYVAALEWADSLGAHVLSSSLAYDFGYTMDGTEGITTLAANTAASRGLLLVTAMGNSGPMPTTLDAPADAFGIVSVGAVDAAGTIAPFSSRGPTADGRTKPEVVAQGVAVHAADPSQENAYVAVSGTSFSTPITAASAALLLEAHPDWSPLMVREALMQSADRRGAPDNAYGWGRFALLPALDYAPAGALQLVPEFIDRFGASDWQLVVNSPADSGRRPVSVVARFERVPGATDSVPLVQQSDSLWSAVVPWLGETGLRFRLEALDESGRTVRVPPDPHRQFELLSMPGHLAEDFEQGALRWARGGTHDLFWPQAASAFEGMFALADSPGGGYPDSCDAWISNRGFTVVGYDLPWHLTLRTRYQLSLGDTGHVEWHTYGDSTWTTAAKLTGTQTGWQLLDFVLPLLPAELVQLRFRLVSDEAVTGDGWYVDSVRLGASPLSVDEPSPVQPVAHVLSSSPNPFNGATRLGIRLDRPADVKLFVYDVLGRRVRVLWQGALDAGSRTFAWDARDDHGKVVGSGVYLAVLQADQQIVTRKLLLLK